MYRHSNCKFLEVHIVLIIQLFQDLDNSAQNFYFNKSYSSFPRDITFNLIKFSTCTFILIKSSTTCKWPLYGPQVWTDGSLDKSSAQDMRIWVVDTYMGVKSVVLMTKTTDLHNGVQHWLALAQFLSLYISNLVEMNGPNVSLLNELCCWSTSVFSLKSC